MAGMSSTFGLGASTSSWTDVANARSILICGSNAAENHPIIMQHIRSAKLAGAKTLVMDPRETPTAAQSDHFLRLRPGTDVAVLGAIIHYILTHGLFDSEYLRHFTNASYKIRSDYAFSQGLFSGYNSAQQSYSTDSWAYKLDSEGLPLKAQRLDDPGTVFSLLRDHFRRYDLQTVEAVSGVASSAIALAAETLASHRPLTILYALGVTQHTTAVQTIRNYAILSLLLGSAGSPGGGIIALRGEPNIQGATDLGVLSTHLPGYLPIPLDFETELTAYTLRNGIASHMRLLALLKAWFGSAASAENGWAFSFLPRLSPAGPATYSSLLTAMSASQFQVAVAAGINPMLSAPDNQVVQQALAALDLLVVIDLFATETADFWQMPGVKPEEIGTEVLFLPATFLYEKAGTLTGNGRWIQWTPQVVAPEGDAKPDLEIIDLLFQAVRRLYANSSLPKDRPILSAVWDYGHTDAERVPQEINGFTATGDPISSLEELLSAPEGTVSSGCWLYAGVYGSGNLAKRKVSLDTSSLGLYPGWGYSWPANIRLLYNRASCDAEGQPKVPGRQVVWWNSETLRWEGHDIPDVSDPLMPPKSIGNPKSFHYNAEGVARLFTAQYAEYSPDATLPNRVSTLCQDGPLPEFYEPTESPVANLLHPSVSFNPLVPAKRPSPSTTHDRFPYILTTYTPGANSCSPAPEPAVELSPQLASSLNLHSGTLVEVSSPRGSIRARVTISSRLCPHRINGQLVHTVGMPYGAGLKNLAPNNSVNTLTSAAADPTSGTPEYKCCMVNIVKCPD